MLRCYRPVATELSFLATFLSIENQTQLVLFALVCGPSVWPTISKGFRISTAKRQRVVVKVLGAELYQIAQILLSTTSKQLVIATLISIPLVSYLTQQYLHKFSEYVNLSWRHYVIPLTLLILLLISTVAIVVWRAAKGNPVDALKHE